MLLVYYFQFIVSHLLKKIKSLSNRKLKKFFFSSYKSSNSNRGQKIIQKIIHVSLCLARNFFTEMYKLLGKYLIELHPTGINLWVIRIKEKTRNIIQSWLSKDAFLFSNFFFIFMSTSMGFWLIPKSCMINLACCAQKWTLQRNIHFAKNNTRASIGSLICYGWKRYRIKRVL